MIMFHSLHTSVWGLLCASYGWGGRSFRKLHKNERQIEKACAFKILYQSIYHLYLPIFVWLRYTKISNLRNRFIVWPLGCWIKRHFFLHSLSLFLFLHICTPTHLHRPLDTSSEMPIVMLFSFFLFLIIQLIWLRHANCLSWIPATKDVYLAILMLFPKVFLMLLLSFIVLLRLNFNHEAGANKQDTGEPDAPLLRCHVCFSGRECSKFLVL